MRISDWSSDVCSSDLRAGAPAALSRGDRQLRNGAADQLRPLPPTGAGLAGQCADPVEGPAARARGAGSDRAAGRSDPARAAAAHRSEEHTSELQSLMRISYAVFCLKKKKTYKDLR